MSRNKRIALAFLFLVGSAEIALARSTLLLGCSLVALAAWHCWFSEAAVGTPSPRSPVMQLDW